MPWLIKDESFARNLFLVHIPRCGGTSLTKSHNVPERAMESAEGWVHKLGMRLFFYTYYLWETDNYPTWTLWNAVCWSSLLWNGYLRFGLDLATIEHAGLRGILEFLRSFAVFNMLFSLVLSAGLSRIFVAPNFSRDSRIRRYHLRLVHYLFLNSMDHKKCVTGMTLQGWILHLTAHKLLNYGYVTPDEFDTAVTMAIVRNPYSRMVSLYMYNRFSPTETFKEFVDSWYKEVVKPYRQKGIVEEWETPCHSIPQFEYTHYDGVQVVQSIVKYEEIPDLIKDEDSVGDRGSLASLSDDSACIHKVVKAAFVGMPRCNERKTPKPWYEYYDQETMDRVYELYQMDFAIFDYPLHISERPDLRPPIRLGSKFKPPDLERMGIETFVRNSNPASSKRNKTFRSFRHAVLEKARTTDAYESSMAKVQKRLQGRSASMAWSTRWVHGKKNNNNNNTANGHNSKKGMLLNAALLESLTEEDLMSEDGDLLKED